MKQLKHINYLGKNIFVLCVFVVAIAYTLNPKPSFAAAGINQTITLQGKVVNTNGTNVTDGAYDFSFVVYNGAGSGASSLFTENWTNAALFSSTMTSAPSSSGESLVYGNDTNEATLKVGQILWNTTKQESVTITSVDTGTNTIGISPTFQAWSASDTITNRIYVKDGIFRVALNSLNQNWSSVDFGDDSIFVGINFNADGEMKPRIRFSAAPYAMTANNALNLGGISSTGYLRSNTDDTFESGHTLTVAGDIDMNGAVSIADTDITLDGATTNLAATGDFSINTDDFFINKSTGNVAIGSTNPGTAKLHVTGDLVATGTIVANTNETINGIDINAGTISDATWNGSIVSALYGGTGANLSSVAQYSIPYFSSTGILGGAVAPGTTGYVLATNSTGGAPSWVSADAIAPYQWRLLNEQLSPTNALNYDVLVGGTSTASATIALQATTGAITGNKLYVRDTNATNTLNLNWNENDTANRTLNFAVGGGDRYLTMNRSLTVGGSQDGNLTYNAAATLTVEGTTNVDQDLTTDANPTFAGLNADAINVGITGTNVIDTDSGNLVLGVTTDIGSSTTGLRISTTGQLIDIDGTAVSVGEDLNVVGAINGGSTITAGDTATYDPITISPVAKGTNTYTGTLTSEDLTAARSWTLPNKDGIFAMMSDVTGATHNAVTLGAIGSTPNANGMTLSTQILNLEPASVNFGGVVTTGTQSFAGDKTFTGAFVLGDNGDLGSINTSDWDINTTGDMSGIGTIAANGNLTLSSPVANGDNLVFSPYQTGSNTFTGTLTSSDLTGDVTWTLPSTTTSLMGNPMTTAGDIIYGGTAGAPTRLAGAGADNYVLKYDTDTNVPYWGVDNNSGSTYTASNGLTLATADFQLGGDLTKDTTITQDNAESLSFVNAGTGNTVFNLSSTGDMVIQDNGTPFVTFTDSGTMIVDSLTLDGTGITSSGALGLSSAAGSDITLTSHGNAFTLPTTAGSNGYLLSTNGSGTLSWTDPAGLGGSGVNYWNFTGQQLSPTNLALDLMLGGTATASAPIALQANTGAATVNALYIRDSNASNTLHLNWNENDTADRTLNLALGNGDRYLTLNEDFTIGNGFAGTLTYTANTSLTIEGLSAINQDLTTDASPTFAGGTLGNITIGLTDDNVLGTSTGPLNITPTAGSNVNINLSGTGDFTVNSDDLYVDTSTGFVGIGTDSPTAQLDIAGTTSTITNSSGDITIDAASDNISFAGDSLININNAFISGSMGINTVSPTQILDVNGNARIRGSLTLDPMSSSTVTDEGTVYYDSDTDHLYVYTGDSAFHRVALDLTQYSVNNASVTNGSYVEIAHNQNTSDLTLVGWVKNTLTGLWEKITDKSVTVKQSLQNEFDSAAASGKIRVSTVGGYSGSSIQLNQSADVGNGADGSITVASNTNINTTPIASGRTCADAINYSVTSLTPTSATLSTTPAINCLAVGDEVLLINLQGISTYSGNVGNYETVRIASINTDVVNFTTAKTKYYGNSTDVDDSNIGTATTNQRVMLQRVPNYTNITINSGITLTSSAWNGTKGGVLFFKASGTATITGTINSNGIGYRSFQTPLTTTSYGGESFCSTEGGGRGPNGAAGTDGVCGGGGGGGQLSAGTGGAGSASFGGAGGGGGSYSNTTGREGGAGGGGGYGTFGYAGTGGIAGVNGGTNTSGKGGDPTTVIGDGGGGGTYGDAALTKLFFGSAGGTGGAGYTSTAGGAGGDGGGIIAISANTITVSGSISSGGTVGTVPGSRGGPGGAGAGGSIKLIGNNVSLGSSLVTAAGGAASDGYGDNSGGAGGSGRIAVFYATAATGVSSPGASSTQSGYYPYGLYHSGVISTPNAISLSDLRWDATPSAFGKVSFQTRSGNSTNPTDGTWEAWRPAVATTNYLSLQDANTHTDWAGTNMTVAEGDVTRDVAMFEDEDEATATNLTQLASSTNGGYAESTIASTDLSNYDYLTFWVRASQTGNTVQIGMGESAATEQTEMVTIDAANTWQKVYWDLSDIAAASRNAITKLRLTNLTASANTIYIDNIKAEKLMTTATGTQIASTPNNYLQYRAIFTTTNSSYQPRVNNVQFSYNDGFKIVQTDANTVRLYNASGETQELRLDAVVFGADLAEWYAVEDQAIGAGDIVALTGFLDDYSVPILRKATRESGPNIVGVISTKAGTTLGLESPERRLLGLAGRVPVKVASDSGQIKAGDFIAASDVPGMARPAQWGDMIIGKALESWAPTSDKSTVLMLINDPAPYYPILTRTLDQVSTIVEGATYMAKTVIDNVTVTNNLTSVSIDTDKFSTNIASVSGLLTAREAEFDSATISGLVAGTVDVATLSAQTFYATHIISPTIDNAVSTLSARISTLESKINDQTISLSNDLTKYSYLDTMIASLSARFTNHEPRTTNHELTDIVATESALTETLVASDSSTLTQDLGLMTQDLNLNVESIFVSDFLSVTGESILTNVAINGTLSIGNWNITATESQLSFGDLLTLDATGNLVTINGDLNVLGIITAKDASIGAAEFNSATISGTLTVDTIYNKQLEQLASQSANLAAQVASLSAVLGVASPGAALYPAFDPTSFAKPGAALYPAPTPVATQHSTLKTQDSPTLPMSLEEFLSTQPSP